MSANRILKKRQKMSSEQELPEAIILQSMTSQNLSSSKSKSSQKNKAKIEQQFQNYVDYAQSNSKLYEFSNKYLPCNASLHNKFKLPISIFLPPVAYQTHPVERSIDKIPRCQSCRAYMNYYNQIKKKDYKCFLCGQKNLFKDYLVDTQNVQLCQPSYHVLGEENVNKKVTQKGIAFLVDVHNSAFQSKMLYYFVAAMKQVLAREQFNDQQIFFFTYDQVIHEYDFSGEEIKCTILDPTIKNSLSKIPQQIYLQNIRNKLFYLLDNLEEIAQNNRKQGSRFFQAFKYVTSYTKTFASKIYIFQANQSVSGEHFLRENIKCNSQIDVKRKSFLESKNKTFFNQFIQTYVNESISCSFFFFQKNYKNLKVFGDFCKFTCSELFSYRKDVAEDLTKFYYDLTYVLGTIYYKEVKMELLISTGWYFTAIYGNALRVKQPLTFKMCSQQISKKLCISLLPQQTIQLPYCCIQIISSYTYSAQHFVTVNTIVWPMTTSLDKLFANQNYIVSAATLSRIQLSSLRVEEIQILRSNLLKQSATILKTANEYYRKNVPQQIYTLMLNQLAILKSSHFQLDSINQTIILDSIVAQRNYLQSCPANEISNFFNPYLFNLSTMTEQMCQYNDDFVYPQICELKFNQVKEGIFLMDNGLTLFLFIAKSCNPFYLQSLFGKDKLPKSQTLSEESFVTNTLFAQQVINLIKCCRQYSQKIFRQKSFGWMPLYIVKCGENSLNQKIFYMNFYAEKYDEFRGFKHTLNQFLTLLGQQY